MSHYRVVVLPGDGIGPEVTAEAVRVLEAAAELHGLSLTLEEHEIGAAGVAAFGDSLPPSPAAASEWWPTAPSSTASTRVTPAAVAGGSESPASATPAAPTANSRASSVKLWTSAAACSTRSASAVTSGPIPSPGSTAMV